MFSPEKIKFAKDVLWDGMSFQHSTEEMNKIAFEAYPQVSALQSGRRYPSYEIMGLIAKHDISLAKDLLNVLIATEPDVVYQEGAHPFYSFEMVGANINTLRRVVEEELKAGRMTQGDYLDIYQQISAFKIFKDGAYGHSFLNSGHLKTLFKDEQFDAFECVFNILKQQDSLQSWAVFVSMPDLTKPFFSGRMRLHNDVMESFLKHVESDRYSVTIPTKFFWDNSQKLTDFLVSKNDPSLWKEGIRMAGEVFGLQRFYPLKDAVKNGYASKALTGQVALFMVAKRHGYAFSVEELRTLIDPIERLAKTIGADWTKQIPESIGNGITEVLGTMDKKELLKGKRSKNLIQSLNELMPGQGWMNFAQQKDKKTILMDQLGL